MTEEEKVDSKNKNFDKKGIDVFYLVMIRILMSEKLRNLVSD